MDSKESNNHQKKKGNKQKDTKLVTLQNETIEKIFLYLDHYSLLQMMLLSKYWYNKIKSLDLKVLSLHYCYNLSNKCLRNALSIFPNINELSLHGCPELDNKIYKGIKQLKNLSFLKITNCKNIDNKLFQGLLAQNVQNLVSLKLSSGSFGEKLFDGYTMLENLKKLDLSYNSGVTDKLIKILQTKTPNIEVLKINGCKNISSSGISQLYNLKSLKKLSLGYMDKSKVEPNSFKALTILNEEKLPHLINLEYLNVAGTNISNSSTNSICRSLTNLKQLHLGWCPNLNGEGLANLHKLKNLETLTLEFTLIDPSTLKYIDRMKNIKYVSLMGCAIIKRDRRIEYAKERPYLRMINSYADYLS